MKRFSNLFVYEKTDFQGTFTNCKLLEDIFHENSKHIFAMTGEVFPTIIVNIEKSEIYFFEEFDNQMPMFSIHFKICYI